MQKKYIVEDSTNRKGILNLKFFNQHFVPIHMHKFNASLVQILVDK